MDRPTPPAGAPPSYFDDPPAYGYSEPSILDDRDDYTAPPSSAPLNNASTMRLLPAGSDDNTDAYSSARGDIAPGGQFAVPDRVTTQRRQYVNTRAEAPPSYSPSNSLMRVFRSARETLSPTSPKDSAKDQAKAQDTPSDHNNTPKPGSDKKSPNRMVKWVTEKNQKPLGLVDTSKLLEISDIPPLSPIKTNSDPLMVPAPLRLAVPKVPPQLKPRPLDSHLVSQTERFLPRTRSPDSNGLSTIHESKEEVEANRGSRSPVLRPSSQRYQPLHDYNASTSTLPISRPPSSIGNPPYIPPPVTQPEGSQFGSRPASPTRPWTPRSDRSRRPPSVSGVQYEPVDINGNPRPGTPSSQYGGSPRRPLPPAPLFAAPSSVSGSVVGDHSIDIGEGNGSSRAPDDDDPFGGNGRTMDPNRRSRGSVRSYGSYLSDDTMVSEGKESMSKISLNDDDYDYDDDTYSSVDAKVHYGPAPTGRQDRRGVRQAQMTKKEVKLINGELVLECKIPTILHSFLPRRDDREFTHMRYTAVTCDPDEFTTRGYKLRQSIGTTTRETELLVCVTMYNEDEIHFTRTMHGIMRNISHFCSRKKSRTWGKDGWQKIVVCIIADGRQKVHPRTLDALAAMGVYQSGIAKNIVNQKKVTAHVYEYTTQVSLDPDLKFKGAEKGMVPCQVIFCLKEHNQKKLNSHRWLFNAFGRALNPNICIMLDVGTKPAPTALYHLWKAFDQDSNVAGAAGEIKAGKGKNYLGLFNPLVASQNFEYKMSNILDKPLESVFGYITVLPGALSAYRYHALQNDSTGHGPLSQYFKGEMLHGKNADVFTANMYLAEDRILCWELVAKRDEQWLLKFVKSAVGETDVPDSVPEFISQRRRWLNGAFFAAVYSLIHFRQIWKTDHTIGRKILLHIEFIYQFVSLIFTFFSLANFYITFYFIAGSLAAPEMDPFGHNVGKYIFIILRYACVLLICLQFILSMGNRPQGAKKMFMTSMIVYCIIMIYTVFAALYMVVIQLTAQGDPDLSLGNNMFTNIIVSTLSTVGLYFVMSFLYLDPWHMFTSSAQYFALLPSYLCTLQTYAFCNTHDVTWGTKGDNVTHTDLGAARTVGSSTVELEMPSEQLDIDSGYDEALRNLRDRLEVEEPPPSEMQMQEDYYRAVRTYMVSIWVAANAILAMAVSEAYSHEEVGSNGYLAFVLWSVAALAVFRAVGSSTFAFLNLVHKLAEGRMKFVNASGSTGSSTGATSAVMSHRTTSEKVSDWCSETMWEAKRKFARMAFWRR